MDPNNSVIKRLWCNGPEQCLPVYRGPILPLKLGKVLELSEVNQGLENSGVSKESIESLANVWKIIFMAKLY